MPSRSYTRDSWRPRSRAEATCPDPWPPVPEPGAKRPLAPDPGEHREPIPGPAPPLGGARTFRPPSRQFLRADLAIMKAGSSMKYWWRRSVLVLLFASLSLVTLGQRAGRGQGGQSVSPDPKDDARLPSGKLQRDEILKAEHEQNIKDAAQLAELVQQLQVDLEKEDRFVLSMSTLKRTEDIEKLARKIRTRLRHN